MNRENDLADWNRAVDIHVRIQSDYYHPRNSERQWRRVASLLRLFFLLPDSSNTLTDSNGKFLIRTQPGFKTVRVSYTGYKNYSIGFLLLIAIPVFVFTGTEVAQLKEAIVSDRRYSQRDWIWNYTHWEQPRLHLKRCKLDSGLGGEADVIKSVAVAAEPCAGGR